MFAQHSGSESITTASGEVFEIGELLAASKTSDIYKSNFQGKKYVIKKMRPSIDEEMMLQKTRIEVELLKALYGNEIRAIEQKLEIRGMAFTLPVIIMPYFEGELLEDKHYNPPLSLKSCNFNQRAHYSYQYFDQLDKLHKKAAVVSDIHGENIKIDFNEGCLHLFDFGASCILNTTRLINRTKDLPVETNDIAQSPEWVHQNQVGIISDMYGSIVPIMLLWGAQNPSRKKQTCEKPADILDAEFVEDGLLDFEIPAFIVPLDSLVRAFIHRLGQKDIEERLQFAVEGKEFFKILTEVSDEKSEYHGNKNEAIKVAARLITIASGHGYYFKMFFNFENLIDCQEIVNLYLSNLENLEICFKDLRERYNDAESDYVLKAIPTTHNYKIETVEEYKEIVSSYQINPEATLIRFQLIDLIHGLLKLMDSRHFPTQQKKCIFTECLAACKTDYLNLKKTYSLFAKICVAAVPRITFGRSNESVTGKDLKNYLNSQKYPALFKYIPKKSTNSIDALDLLNFVEKIQIKSGPKPGVINPRVWLGR